MQRFRLPWPLAALRPSIASALFCGLFASSPAWAQDPAPNEKPGGDTAEGTTPVPPSDAMQPETKTAAPPVEGAPQPHEDAAPAHPPPAATPAAPPAAQPAPAPAPPPNTASESRETTYGGPLVAGDKNWMFDFHGYFRAPLRMGIGDRSNPAPGQGSTTYHRPIIPDDQYLNWQYTGRGSDWAELFFSVGNPIISGTVGITGYQFTDAAWAKPDAQFGIALGYLTIRPDLPWKNVRAEFVVGSHWNRYGQAGKYDSGKYDTFVFGRTHVIGYKARGEIDIGDVTLWAEQGFGAHRPDPSIYNTARFTLLNHGHAGLKYGPLSFGFHYLHSYAAEEARDGAPDVCCNLDGSVIPADKQPDGSLDVFGPEIRAEGGPFGDLYVAYSRINATNAATVSSAIEVLHSMGGGEFANGVAANYLDAPRVGGEATNTMTPSSRGNGSVDTLAAQYEFHVNRVYKPLNPQDVTIFLFGMYNHVFSQDPNLDGDPKSPTSSINKVKWGVDGVVDILPWFGAAFRFDRVQPNSKIPEQSFSTIYPRLLFRTNFVTRELISLGYTRYFYNARSCAANMGDPNATQRCVQPPSAPTSSESFGAIGTGSASNQPMNTRGAPGINGLPQLPDKGVVTLEASMWW
jgi:hypothetical protein